MQTPLTARQEPLPAWILVFGSVLAAIGTAFGLALLLAPGKIFAGLDLTTPSLAAMVQGLAGRTLTMALAAALAVYSRNPTALLVVFCMRFFTEVQDLITSFLTKGFDLFDVSFISVILALEILAIARLAAILRGAAKSP